MPLILEICDDIRQVFFEIQLIRPQIKAILDIKNTSVEAFQYIVNQSNKSNHQKNEIEKSKPQDASILPLNELVRIPGATLPPIPN